MSNFFSLSPWNCATSALLSESLPICRRSMCFGDGSCTVWIHSCVCAWLLFAVLRVAFDGWIGYCSAGTSVGFGAPSRIGLLEEFLQANHYFQLVPPTMHGSAHLIRVWWALRASKLLCFKTLQGKNIILGGSGRRLVAWLHTRDKSW